MKRTDPESIGDVLRMVIEENNMTDRLYERKAVALWPEIVGDVWAQRMSRPRVMAGVMVVYVDSAALRQELNMCRSQLTALINKRLGREVIKEIRFK